MASSSDHLSTDNQVIVLRGGLRVSLEVLDWILAAEDRGIRFSTEPEGRVRLSPTERVRPDDVVFARAHREQIRQCVAYIESQC